MGLSPSQQPVRVAIVGGGLAGLAAAVALCDRPTEPPLAIDLFEARRRLGGRAASFRDPASGELISCSIDPTADGLVRLARAMRQRDGAVSDKKLARFEEALGPQRITLTGVPQDSHFARVLVAADFTMKRLGMNFEPAPIDGLPSYLDLLGRGGASTAEAEAAAEAITE